MKTDVNSLVKLSTYASIAVASIILIIKSYAFFITDSVSILASLLDSLLDIASSVINMLAVRYALMPADDNHRFGHDKIQDLAVFAQSIFFGASGVFVVFLALPRFFDLTPVESSEIGINVMIVSIILTFGLVTFQSYVVKISRSKIIEADKLHYFVDLLSNVSVIMSLLLGKYFGIKYADPVFAILIAIYIIYSAYKLLMSSVKNLIDEEFSDDEKKSILKILKNHKAILGIHELKTRYAGNKAFIQFHMEIDGNITLMEAYKISDEVELKIKKHFPESEIIIHQDPAGFEHDMNFKLDLKK